MSIQTSYGNITYNITRSLSGTEIGHNGPDFAISARQVLSDRTTDRRVKPRTNLIFSPTSYSRSRMVQKWGQTFSIAKTIYNTTEYQRSSAAFYPYDTFVEIYPPEPSNVINQALVRLKNDAVNFGTMLGEYKSTSNMFLHIGGAIVAAYQKAKHGFINEAVKHLVQAGAPSSKGRRKYYRKYGGKRYEAIVGGSSISNAWLQYHFGIDQLLNDLTKAVKELNGTIQRRPDPIVRASATSTTSFNQVVLINGRPAAYYSKWRDSYVVVAQVGLDEVRWLSDHGLTSALSLAWESTHLSWAVDYVIKIGEWLEALDVPVGFKQITAWKSTKKWGGGVALPSAPPNYEAWLQPPSASVNFRQTARSVLVPTAVAPRWKPSPTTIHIASLIALAKQTINNRR